MSALCWKRPPEWWSPEDPGARLALMLCAACPARQGDRCRAGLPDPKPSGVIRAGIAYNDRGLPLPVCGCGYPHASYTGGDMSLCDRCKVPDVPIPDPKAVRRRTVVLMLRDGATDSDIARTLRISRDYARKHRNAVQRLAEAA